MKILLHLCCAPCAVYLFVKLREEFEEIMGFWYNPNIHPYTEHQHRLEAMQTLAQQMTLPLIVTEGYDIIDYFRQVVRHESQRCQYCFRLRLSKTTETARQMAFDAFTSTLLISPQQKHELLKEIGEKIAKETGVDFLYADLRKRYSDSRHITKPLELYRQQYCGCVYSEWERYANFTIK